MPTTVHFKSYWSQREGGDSNSSKLAALSFQTNALSEESSIFAYQLILS
jgi:hypothetical protein